MNFLPPMKACYKQIIWKVRSKAMQYKLHVAKNANSKTLENPSKCQHIWWREEVQTFLDNFQRKTTAKHCRRWLIISNQTKCLVLRTFHPETNCPETYCPMTKRPGWTVWSAWKSTDISSYCALWQTKSAAGFRNANCSQLLATFDSLWQLVSTFNNFWQLVATFGNFWQLVATFNSFWQLLATCGNFWQLFVKFFLP